jgi:hypothetical protein
MTLIRRPRRLIALAVCACLLAAGLIGAQSSVAKTKSCPDPPSSAYPDKQKGGYFTNFKVTNVTCKSALKLAKAYYKCRRKKGIKGSCSGRTVNGMKCTEYRPASGDNGTEFNATVTCKKGSKKVKHSYQQVY